MVASKVANQQDKYAELLSAPTQVRKGGVVVVLCAECCTLEVQPLLQSVGDLLRARSYRNGANEVELTAFLFVGYDGPHDALPRSNVTQQRVY